MSAAQGLRDLGIEGLRGGNREQGTGNREQGTGNRKASAASYWWHPGVEKINLGLNSSETPEFPAFSFMQARNLRLSGAAIAALEKFKDGKIPS